MTAELNMTSPTIKLLVINYPNIRYRNFLVDEGFYKLGSSVIHVDYQHLLIKKAVESFHSEYK